jgi:transcriptional regulator with XRE-family HTH domain
VWATTQEEDIGIGGRLRTARERRGWSREQLAVEAGVSWSAIAQVEGGRRRHLRPGTLAALAASLGVTTDYLICGRPTSVPMLEHRALLYSSESEFLDAAAPFLSGAIARGEGALAVTSMPNIELLRHRLGGDAESVELVERSQWYASPLAALTRYQTSIDQHLERGAPWVRVVGEPAWDGPTETGARLWTRYESLLNLVFSASPVTIVCPYDVRALDPAILDLARATHPRTVEGDALSPSPQYVDPSGFLLDERG